MYGQFRFLFILACVDVAIYWAATTSRRRASANWKMWEARGIKEGEVAREQRLADEKFYRLGFLAFAVSQFVLILRSSTAPGFDALFIPLVAWLCVHRFLKLHWNHTSPFGTVAISALGGDGVPIPRPHVQPQAEKGSAQHERASQVPGFTSTDALRGDYKK